ncbi:hypothetical protein MMC15_007744 [Xylographa vitiligo]|nr:hypothetical protein [Xylographa vitiligo]
MSNKAFPYRPLRSKREFRFLVLEAGRADDPICCRLLHAEIDNAPDFEALSYVWAQVPGRQIIQLYQDDHPEDRGLAQNLSHRSVRPLHADVTDFAVTSNLFAGLRRLRYPQRLRVLWIDQVCINQSDIQERSAQVSIMRDVYSQAFQVLVWLGDGSPEDDDVMDFVPYFSSCLRRLNHNEAMRYPLYLYGLPNMSMPIWPAFEAFLRKPWFSRVWTAPEVIVSQSAVVLCGSKHVSLELLNKCFSECTKQPVLIATLLSTRPEGSLRYLQDAMRRTAGMENFQRSNSRDAEGFMFLDILKAFGTCKSNLPEDKVFALYSLLPISIRRQFEAVDYTRTVEEVYTGVATTTVQCFKNLDILFHAGISVQALNLPSWVPDWSTSAANIGFGESARESVLRQKDTAPDKDIFPLYAATKGSTSAARIDAHTKVLSVEAQIISEIEILGTAFDRYFPMEVTGPVGSEAFQASAEITTMIESRRSACFALASSCVPFRYQSKHDAALACMHCLVAGMTNDKQRVRSEDLPNGFHQLEEIAKLFSAIAEAATVEEIASIQAKTHTAIIFGHMTASASIGRVFCLSNDKYMLLAPIGTKVGDKICVIHGLPVPFIIRPEREMFLLVGECYVQGVMDGEVMDMEHVKTQVIDLK